MIKTAIVESSEIIREGTKTIIELVAADESESAARYDQRCKTRNVIRTLVGLHHPLREYFHFKRS